MRCPFVSIICNIHDSASLIVDCKSWTLEWDSLVPSPNVVIDSISIILYVCKYSMFALCYAAADSFIPVGNGNYDYDDYQDSRGNRGRRGQMTPPRRNNQFMQSKMVSLLTQNKRVMK